MNNAILSLREELVGVRVRDKGESYDDGIGEIKQIYYNIKDKRIKAEIFFPEKGITKDLDFNEILNNYHTNSGRRNILSKLWGRIVDYTSR